MRVVNSTNNDCNFECPALILNQWFSSQQSVVRLEGSVKHDHSFPPRFEADYAGHHWPEAVDWVDLHGPYDNRVDISAHPVRVPIVSGCYLLASLLLMKKAEAPTTPTPAIPMITQAQIGIPPDCAGVSTTSRVVKT